MHIVVNVSRTEEGVVVDLHPVVLPQSCHQVRVDLSGVGSREDMCEIRHVVIDLVALDAVVVFNTFKDAICGICNHGGLAGLGNDGNE